MEAGEPTEARASADQGGVGHQAQGRSSPPRSLRPGRLPADNLPAEDNSEDPSEVVDGAGDSDGIGGDEGGTTFAAAKQGRASGVPNWDASEAVAVVWACLAASESAAQLEHTKKIRKACDLYISKARELVRH